MDEEKNKYGVRRNISSLVSCDYRGKPLSPEVPLPTRLVGKIENQPGQTLVLQHATRQNLALQGYSPEAALEIGRCHNHMVNVAINASRQGPIYCACGPGRCAEASVT